MSPLTFPFSSDSENSPLQKGLVSFGPSSPPKKKFLPAKRRWTQKAQTRLKPTCLQSHSRFVAKRERTLRPPHTSITTPYTREKLSPASVVGVFACRETPSAGHPHCPAGAHTIWPDLGRVSRTWAGDGARGYFLRRPAIVLSVSPPRQSQTTKSTTSVRSEFWTANSSRCLTSQELLPPEG